VDLKGKVALVLGAVKGIGRGIGLALAKEGVRVALAYHDWEEHVKDMEVAFAATDTEHLIVKTDLTEPVQIRSLIDKAIQKFGRIDILINNIERGGWPVVHGPYAPEQWDLEVATTLKAKWWVYHYCIPHLKASGDGVVINISSIAGVVGRAGPAGMLFNDAYSAANRGISAFTETWARDAAPTVRVNEIMLGIFETRHGPNTRGWGILTEHQRQEIIDHTLLKRIGTIADIIKVVIFVIRDAPFMTGSVLRIDGGYLLGGEFMEPMPEGVL
jgi:3-oxoacyl-[acyl-carrier protein] reductase